MGFLSKGRSKLTTKPAGKITKTKTPVRNPGSRVTIQSALMKSPASVAKQIATAGVSKKTKAPTAMKPPVMSSLRQDPGGSSFKRSSPKPAARSAGSTESVNNQPSAQEEVKKLAKGPGMKTSGLASKGYGKAFLNSKR
jgi:hypothetical protein